MIERTSLESSASWTNFFIFFGLAVLLLFACPWICYIWDFSRAKSDGIYARADWSEPGRRQIRVYCKQLLTF